MAETPSTMLKLGTQAPEFELPDPDGNKISLEDFDDKEALVVIFMCNHCPYVKHIRGKLAEVAREYQKRGVGFVGINSNDIENYPDDRPEKMKEVAEQVGFPFPYLFDESQEVAKAYRAACTPDIYLFDDERRLVYRGQFDDSRPGNSKPVTGKDLIEAIEAVIDERSVNANQTPSIGCGIKWKPGNKPDYLG